MNGQHIKRVEETVRQVKHLYEQKRPFRIFHGSTNSTRILSFKKDEVVDVSRLNHVISVNIERQTAIVEPNVPMDVLVQTTLKHGLVPPVVMEFPGITVGGGIQGGAGESSSYKWGCFNQTFHWYEMILPNGEIVKASPTENADLFYGTAGSFGTLGIITAAEVQLIPAKKYVQLTYTSVGSFDESVTTMATAAKQHPDYIDGILFSRDSGVIMTGVLSNETKGKVERFTRAHDQWFYLHVEAVLSANDKKPVTETIPLTDYLFRYDRGAFWVGRFAFDMFDVPYTRFRRWVFNPIMHTRKLYQALQESGASQRHIVQDLALPQKNAAVFMEFIDTTFSIYPLWLCPLLPDTRSPFQSNNLKTPMVINVGVWGSQLPSHEAFIKANRLIEKELLQLGGKKWFYAHSYYTKKEFWTIYDKKLYDALRSKYSATLLPTIYDKVTVKEQFPIDLRKGVWRTIFGRAKLRIGK
jgi:delta24-sterol reductase